MTVPALIQIAGGSAGSGAVTATFSSPNTAGNFLVAFCTVTSGAATFTVSDGTNGRYYRLVEGGSGTSSQAIYITPIPTPTVNNSGQGVTVTMTPSAGTNARLIIHEWSGLDSTNPMFLLDQAIGPASGTSTTPSAGTFGTLAENGELILSFAATSGGSVTWTAGSGFTLDGSANPRANQPQYQVISDRTGPTASCTMSASQAWTSVAVALRSAKQRKVIAYFAGTTFTAPSDWGGIADRVDAIGGGGAGRNANSANNEGTGGGGGAYTYDYNVLINNGDPMQIGAGGSTNAAAGTDTWVVSTGTLRAKGGAGGALANGGIGGAASSCIPAANAVSGGTGGVPAASSTAGATGGGGAGGPYGAGKNGGNQNATGTTGGTGGGGGGGTNSSAGTNQSASNQAGTAGGNGGWFPGGDTSTNGTGGSGGASGTNSGGGGTRIIDASPLTRGSSGGAGGGGGSDGAGSGGAGGAGGIGGEILLSNATAVGAGGGGGGNGNITSGSANPPGDGGLYGGGGAGGGNGTYTAFGKGANGVLIVTYTPALLAAQTITSSFSNLGANVKYSTTGQSITSAEGTVGRDVAPNLGAITANFGEGNIVYGQNLAGQTIASSEGTIAAALSGDFTTSLSAQTAQFVAGQLLDNIGYLLDQNGVILVGQTAIFQQGIIGLERDASLTAFTVTSAEGTITSNLSIGLTALNIVSAEGFITATAGSNQNLTLGNLFINSVEGAIGLESDHALTAQTSSFSIGTITFSIEFHSFLMPSFSMVASEGVMVAIGPAPGTGPPLFIPPQLGKPVTTRTFSWADMAQRAWGSEFRAPDHRIYQFSGGNYKDSTDMGTTGIYSPNLGTPDNPPQ